MSARSVLPTTNPLPLNCPRCGERLVYVRTDGDVDIYHCANHGVILLGSIGCNDCEFGCLSLKRFDFRWPARSAAPCARRRAWWYRKPMAPPSSSFTASIVERNPGSRCLSAPTRRTCEAECVYRLRDRQSRKKRPRRDPASPPPQRWDETPVIFDLCRLGG